MVKAMSNLMSVACITVALTGCTVSQNLQPFDDDKLVLMQYQDMIEGEDIAVVQTSLGEFTLRFFPSEAPKAVGNFIDLAEQGYFDGEKIAQIEHETDKNGGNSSRFIAGTTGTADKPGSSVYDTNIKEEISYNLAHFPGAVSAYCPDGEVDSRFFIVGKHPVSQEELEELKENNYPEEILKQFKEVGGYPEYWLNSSIFAQVISGLDVVDKILEYPQTPDGKTTELVIKKVEIKKYGENNSEEMPDN